MLYFSQNVHGSLDWTLELPSTYLYRYIFLVGIAGVRVKPRHFQTVVRFKFVSTGSSRCMCQPSKYEGNGNQMVWAKTTAPRINLKRSYIGGGFKCGWSGPIASISFGKWRASTTPYLRGTVVYGVSIEGKTFQGLFIGDGIFWKSVNFARIISSWESSHVKGSKVWTNWFPRSVESLLEFVDGVGLDDKGWTSPHVFIGPVATIYPTPRARYYLNLSAIRSGEPIQIHPSWTGR